jgi:uroporphyrinogen III methyltransferase / synthase
MAYGKVYLVGAGPGDPGLITVRGKECLERADVVIYDNLVNSDLLQYAPKAERIFVGKSPDRHTLLQDEINRVLIDHAARHSRIVRLKGGDPFVFGRGGEEALSLAAKGIPFEIVPGVTAGIAVPAYAGIPVTQRDIARACVFVTGHDPETQIADAIRDATVVVFMPIKNIENIARQLIKSGRKPETPAAMIYTGTTPRQQTIIATLNTIAGKVTASEEESPGLLVVGEVVSLHEQLAWFEQRPLFGKRIVVTRAKSQAGKLSVMLRERGADVFEFPTIQVEPAQEDVPLGDISAYDWIVLTSVNAVDMLFRRLESDNRDVRALAGIKLCVIGAATAQAVSARFLHIDLMPDQYVAESLMDALKEAEPNLKGKRFLLPRADIARSFLPEALREADAEVTELVTYRTTVPATAEDRADALVAYAPDIVTFTSSSTARNFHEIMGEDRLAKLPQGIRYSSIGPMTTTTANELGMPISIEPPQHDIPHLVDAIVKACRVD